MENEELITKVSKVLQREDGSEARITATLMTGAGLHQSIDIYVHRRQSPEDEWTLCSDSPHPDWRTMSVDEYDKTGRSDKLKTVWHNEIFKVASAIGKPMSYLDELDAMFKPPTKTASMRP